MHYHVRFDLAKNLLNAAPVSDIYLVVLETADKPLEPSLIEAGVPGRTKEERSLVIVQPMDGEASSREVKADFGAYQAIRSRHQQCPFHR